MERSFTYFIKRVILFSSPILLLVAFYFISDPFNVLYQPENYGSNYLKTYNRNKISTDVFLKNNKDYNFSSFIFGSSRSSAFHTKAWSPLINDPQPYHYDSFNDNISGIDEKVNYILKQGNHIKNAIIVIDNDTFSEKFDESESIVHLKDYRLSGENIILYHLTFFKSFFKKQYFVSYIDLKIFKTFRPYMEEFFKFKYFYTPISNDFLFPENIEQIKKDSVAYYNADEFKNRAIAPKMLEVSIKKHHVENLKSIASKLKKQKTNYKIIISPLYDQRVFNPVDKEILSIYFGKENIYDFSGKNKYTNDISNYYEQSHYKPSTGSAILKEIYQ